CEMDILSIEPQDTVSRCEIPVVDDKEAVKILSSAYCKDQFDNQHDNVGCCVESMEAAWRALKPRLTVRESCWEERLVRTLRLVLPLARGYAADIPVNSS